MNTPTPNPEFQKELSGILPVEKTAYFEGMNKQHFTSEGVGSRFNKGDLHQLLEDCYKQRGKSLQGDDREELLALGTPEEALLPADVCRYLLVKAPGKMGVIRAADLPEDAVIHVRKTPGKNTQSIQVDVPDVSGLVDVEYGTIIIGKNGTENPTTQEQVWTVFPGFPTPRAQTDVWEQGTQLSPAQLIEKLGPNYYVSMNITEATDEVVSENIQKTSEGTQQKIQNVADQKQM